MTAKIKYSNEPIGNPKVIADFLPPPEDLAFREDGVKITLALSRKSVEFFKSEAQKHNTQYQRMIRRLLDAYAERYAQPLTSRSTRTPHRQRFARAAGRRLP
jgi:predicted DNA binding CopG/RHH family protein